MEGEDKTVPVAESADNNAPADKSYDKLNDTLDKILGRLDNLEKNRLNSRSIKEMAERKVIEQEVAKEEESIRLNRQYSNWEKGKTH